MPVVNEGLEKELAYVTKPTEQKHIRSQWDDADPLMHVDIAVWAGQDFSAKIE